MSQRPARIDRIGAVEREYWAATYRKRPKAARYRPSKPTRKLIGAPKVRKMTAKEKKQAKEMEKKMAA